MMTLQDVMAVGLDAPSAARFAPSIVGIVACSHYFVPGIESVKLAFSQALHASGPSKHAAGLRSASLRPPRAMLLSSFALIAPCLGAQVQVSPRGDPSFIAPPGLGPFGPVMSVAQPMTSTPAASMAADSQSDVRAFQMTLPLDAGIRLESDDGVWFSSRTKAQEDKDYDTNTLLGLPLKLYDSITGFEMNGTAR